MYVNNIVFTGDKNQEIEDIKGQFKAKFQVKDLGSPLDFLGGRLLEARKVNSSLKENIPILYCEKMKKLAANPNKHY